MKDTVARDLILQLHASLTELCAAPNMHRPDEYWENAKQAVIAARKWAKQNNCKEEIRRDVEKALGPYGVERELQGY